MVNQGQAQTAAAEAGNNMPHGKVNRIVVAAFAALVIAVVAAVYFALNFVDSERARNLQEWQIRLGIVADKELMSPGNRPIEIVDGGAVRKDLLA